MHPLLNCRPTITVGETFHLIQNAGQELGAIDSDLAKRGRRVALRRLCGVAPVLISAKSPTLAPFHFRNLSGGLRRRTASALHGPWPRLIERSGATISRGYIRKNDDGPDCHVWDSARPISLALGLLLFAIFAWYDTRSQR